MLMNSPSPRRIGRGFRRARFLTVRIGVFNTGKEQINNNNVIDQGPAGDNDIFCKRFSVPVRRRKIGEARARVQCVFITFDLRLFPFFFFFFFARQHIINA